MLQTSTDLFYTDLPCANSFEQIVNQSKFYPVPADWLILVVDLKGSTAAIQAGRYKTVNFVGASAIAAVLNAIDRLDIPFVFGGDGATLLVPPSCLPVARDALLGVQRSARLAFAMTLRVGIVPVVEVLRANCQISVAKLGLVPGSSQAHFIGGGLTYATDLVKDDRTDNPYQLWETAQAERVFLPNLSGLECRWQDLYSQPREILSLIIVPQQPNERSRTGGPGASPAIYQDVTKMLLQLYGAAKNFRPVHPRQLKLTFNPRKLAIEARLRSRSSHWRDRLRYLTAITLQNVLGWLLMSWGIGLAGVHWGRYRRDVANTVDYCKLDDALRMVIASDRDRTRALLDYLEAGARAGKFHYGVNRSDRALMTCLVFDRNGRQIHFIDGADGGYALAAVDLKRRARLNGGQNSSGCNQAIQNSR
ncbi:MAG: DUF3095 domain-containing protein [Synechococcales cyanobacterium RM1_1_8]|nr:DUF3095 domain-containing protein [Synechococcales cyanobacterium RM1_1_8]